MELGTDRGQATNVVLEACKLVGGTLTSIDIRDCSDAADDENWTFVQASSLDQETVLSQSPVLRNGIDMVYVDSLHTPEHVASEICTWMPLVKPGGCMFFDDVDPGPYAAGRRKDNPFFEESNRQIFSVVESFYRSHSAYLRLSLMLGSTGLAMLDKMKEFSTEPDFSYRTATKPRKPNLLHRLERRFPNKYYSHSRDGSDYVINR